MKRRALYHFLPLRFALLLAALVAAWPLRVQAQVYTGPGGGTFSNPVFWNFGNGPAPSSSLAGSLNILGYGAANYTAGNDLNLTLQTLQLSNFSNSSITLSSLIGGNYAFTGAGGVQLLGSGGVTLSSPVAIGSTATGLTFSGAGRGNLTVSGVISSNGLTAAPVTINTGSQPNAGTVTLSGANTFTSSGGVVLAGGNLSLTNNLALGVFGNSINTLTVSGGSLQGTSTLVNPVQLNGNLTITGGANALTFGAAGGLGIGGLSGTGGVNIQPAGTAQTQIFNVANTYSGATTIGQAGYGLTATPDNPGGLRLNSAAGSIANTSGIFISDGGLFEINKSAGDSVNNVRVNAAAPIQVKGGFVQVIGSTGLTTQAFGTLTGSSSTTLLANTGTGASTTISSANLVRSGAGTFVFAGTNLGGAAAAAGANNANILLSQINGAAPAAALSGAGGAGTPGVSILPWAIGDVSNAGTNFNAGSGFVTYGANGVRVLDTTTEYSNIAAAGTLVAGTNNRIGGAPAAQNTNIALQSLWNTGAFGLTGTGVIDISTGALAGTGSFSIANPVTFGGGTGEAVITSVGALGSANTITASGPLTASTLTKTGQGTLVLGSTANSFTSNRITVNAGVLSIAALNNLGIANAGSSSIELNGQAFSSLKAGLLYTGAGTETMNIPLNLASGHSQVRMTGGGNLTLAGLISGAGGLNIDPGTTANSVITLGNAANTFSGGVRLGSGTVNTFQFASDGALGAPGGPLTINSSGMTVKLQGNWNTARNIALEGALGGGTVVGFDTAGFNSNWSGPVVGGGAIIRADSSVTPGIWSITGAGNPYTGTITLGTSTVAGGKLALTGAGELSSASLIVGVAGNTNASFDISGAFGSRQIASLAGIAGTNVILGANDLITGSSSTTYAGTISGTGRLIKAGTNTLTLSGTNTHGGTEIWGGGVSISNDANLGVATGTLALRGGQLALNTNSVTLNASRNVIFDSTPARLAGDAPSNSLALGTFDLTIAGNVSGAGGFEKGGSGSLIFTGTNTAGSSVANPSSGFFKVNQGAIVFSSDANLGQLASGSFPGTKLVLLSLTGDSVGGTLRLASGVGSVGINRYIAIQNANTNRASIDVGTGSALTYSGTLVGATSSQQVTKIGAGTLAFDANASLFTGTLAVGNGTAATGNVSITSGANLTRTNVQVSAASTATLDMSGLTKEFGNLSLAAGTTLQLGTGGVLATGWNNAAGAIDGVITSTGASSILQAGTGNYTYTAPQTFTGSYASLFAGNTTLSGNGAFGTLAGLTIGAVGNNTNLGPALSLDNSGTNLNTRLSPSQDVYFNNSNLSFSGNAATVTTQVASSYNAAGATTITMAVNGGALNFQNAASGYTRVDRGTTLVRSNLATLGSGPASSTIPNLSFGNLNAGSLAGLAGGTGVQTPILPYMVASDAASATATGNTFATIGANGIVPLSTSTGYSPTFVGSTTNVLSTASTTFSGASGLANALILGGTANTVRLDSAASEALIVDAGAIANTVSQVYAVNAAGNAGTLLGIQTAELQTGNGNTRELIVHNLNADLAIGAKITTTGGFTKSGGYTAAGSTLYLTNAANTYTGGTVVNGGTLAIDTLSAINPVAGNGLTLSGGYLKYRGPSVTFPAGTPLRLGGGSATNAGASGGFNIVSGTTLTIPAGVMTGFGGVSKDGTGVLYAQGVQTFSGPVNLQAGAYAVDNAGGFGTNSRVLFDSNSSSAIGATVQFRANNLTINKDFSIISSNAASGAGFDTMGNNVTLTGAISSPNNNSKGLFKLGDGNLTLTGASNYTGSTQVFGGNLILAGPNGSVLNSGAVASASAFNTASTFLANAGGGIVLDNRNTSGGNNNNRLPDPFTTVMTGGDSATQSGIRLQGGTFTIRGNESAPTTETTNRMDILFGTVTLENNGQNVSLTTGRVSRTSNVSAALIRGNNLGATPGSTSSNWFALDEGAQSTQSAGAGGAIGTPFVNIIPGFMGDSSATGSGTDLVTCDSAVGFRKLTGSEYTSTFGGTITSPNFDGSRAPNLGLGSGVTTAPAFTTWAAALKLGSGAVLNGTGTLNLNQSTLLATGNATVNVSNLQSIGNGGYDILTAGAGTNLTLNSALNGGGIAKYGDGTLTFGGAYNGNGNVSIGQGSVVMSGAGAYLNPSVQLNVVRGATFDLGGVDRLLPAPNFLGALGTNGLGVVQDGAINLGANTYSINSNASTVYTGSMMGTGGFRKL
ncbi:MAG TPA: autotransporter-associated beta strand repeat-containing protein, partial [Verrucomicrobiales bacterium]|nr:autotransporter-associated beta strand repeat-containing protein [Verrucomicrobiales bacterium]